MKRKEIKVDIIKVISLLVTLWQAFRNRKKIKEK